MPALNIGMPKPPPEVLAPRRKSRQIKVGKVLVGGDAPVSVQSMTTTPTTNINATLQQIAELTASGCDIVRVAVPSQDDADVLHIIAKKSQIPVIADIHFQPKYVFQAIDAGCAAVRVNPGNIRKFDDQVGAIAKAAKDAGVSIRIGVNAGSLEKDLLAKHGGPTAEGMVESALRHIRILEDCGYPEMKVSLKASDPLMMIQAYRMLADQVDYPFHLGVTEAGTPGVGTIKSAVGLGALLSQGIGDTIRVSLSADPTEEVRVGIDVLKSLGLRTGGLTFVSCPSCGRADVDLVALARQVEDEFRGLNEEIHIAVMGCLPPGQDVVTPEGPRAIETVTEGDEVLARDGTSRRVVLATSHRFEGELVEVQGTGESHPFTRETMTDLLALAESGVRRLIEAQKAALAEAGIALPTGTERSP